MLWSSQGTAPSAPAVNTVQPAISGLTPVLSAVTGDTGTWTGTTGSALYRHKRDGVIIPGETASTYYRATADIGASLTREVGFYGLDGVLVWAASNALTNTVEATVNTSKSSADAPAASSDAPTQALIYGTARWTGTAPRVITYSFPTDATCFGDQSTGAASAMGYLGGTLYLGDYPWGYAFTITSGTPTLGGVYTNNGQSFRILGVSGSIATAVSKSATGPASSGTLSGTPNLTFPSWISWEAATAQEKTNVRSVMGILERFANFHFFEVSETSSSDPKAILRFSNTALPTGTNNPASGAAPGLGSPPGYNGGDVALQKLVFNSAIAPGSFNQFALLHEIGHALFSGGHPFEASPPLTSSLDWIPYTMMTYRSFIGAGLGGYSNAAGTFPCTPMGIDVKALRYMYGANPRWKPAGVTYKFLPTGEWFIDGVSQGTPAGSKLLMTVIESSNGNDTYDFSAFPTGTVTIPPGLAGTGGVWVDGSWISLPGLVPDMASGSTHAAPGSVFLEYGLNPANKTIIPAAA